MSSVKGMILQGKAMVLFLSGLLAQSRAQTLLYPSGRGFGVWLQSPMQAQESDRKDSILTVAGPCFVTRPASNSCPGVMAPTH